MMVCYGEEDEGVYHCKFKLVRKRGTQVALERLTNCGPLECGQLFRSLSRISKSVSNKRTCSVVVATIVEDGRKV